MEITTIREIIERIDEYSDYSTLYAKKIDGQFRSNSEFVVLELTEDEMSLPTKDISQQKCPGFEYFLEVFLIKDMLDEAAEGHDMNKTIEIIVHYAEYDC
jgi:hypothetical protein